jgi:serine/threonine protein kinase
MPHTRGPIPYTPPTTGFDVVVGNNQGAPYEILGKIGEGTYGVVYLLRYNDRNRSKVALKTFKVRITAAHIEHAYGVPVRSEGYNKDNKKR